MSRRLVFLITALGVCELGFAKSNLQTTVDILAEDTSTLRTQFENLKRDFQEEVQHRNAEIQLLKSTNQQLSEKLKKEVEQIVEDKLSEKNYDSKLQESFAVLESELKKIFGIQNEKVQNAFNHLIDVVCKQKAAVDAMTGATIPSEGTVYEVKKEDSLESIARRFSVTKEELKRINFIPDEDKLPEGQLLFVPKSK